MKWKKRNKELARLRARHKGKKWRPALPDLSVRQVAPCSNRFDAIQSYSRPEPYTPAGCVVDHLHKSSLQVLLRSELPWAGGKKP
jgi:hypothetical protein